MRFVSPYTSLAHCRGSRNAETLNYVITQSHNQQRYHYHIFLDLKMRCDFGRLYRKFHPAPKNCMSLGNVPHPTFCVVFKSRNRTSTPLRVNTYALSSAIFWKTQNPYGEETKLFEIVSGMKLKKRINGRNKHKIIKRREKVIQIWE
jgi:hypothetical protein